MYPLLDPGTKALLHAAGDCFPETLAAAAACAGFIAPGRPTMRVVGQRSGRLGSAFGEPSLLWGPNHCDALGTGAALGMGAPGH
jgi:hypothetical protein